MRGGAPSFGGDLWVVAQDFDVYRRMRVVVSLSAVAWQLMLERCALRVPEMSFVAEWVGKLSRTFISSLRQERHLQRDPYRESPDGERFSKTCRTLPVIKSPAVL